MRHVTREPAPLFPASTPATPAYFSFLLFFLRAGECLIHIPPETVQIAPPFIPFRLLFLVVIMSSFLLRSDTAVDGKGPELPPLIFGSRLGRGSIFYVFLCFFVFSSAELSILSSFPALMSSRVVLLRCVTFTVHPTACLRIECFSRCGYRPKPSFRDPWRCPRCSTARRSRKAASPEPPTF